MIHIEQLTNASSINDLDDNTLIVDTTNSGNKFFSELIENL